MEGSSGIINNSGKAEGNGAKPWELSPPMRRYISPSRGIGEVVGPRMGKEIRRGVCGAS